MEFNGSPRNSIGVEYELQLLDGETLDLADGILPLLAIAGEAPHIQAEYNQSTVEIVSEVAEDVHALESHLLEQVRLLREKCRQLGMKLCGGATHPFCNRLATVTPFPRYREVEATSGYAGAIQMVCATHVHLGVPSGQEAIRLMRLIRPYLPLMLAMSASSPFYMGVDTGFAAYRPRVLLAAHSYGTAPPVDTWEEFAAIWEAARRADVFHTFKDMHWDIRPKPEFGTVEIRIMDAQPTVHATVALVALVRVLAEHLKHHSPDRDPPLLPELPHWLEVENAYRAAHLALDNYLIVTPQGETRPFRLVALELLEQLEPTAERLGDSRYIETLRRSVESGPSYARQRSVYARSGSLRAVSESLVSELDAELDGG